MRARVVALGAVLVLGSAIGCGRSPLRGERSSGSSSNGGAGGNGAATSVTSTTVNGTTVSGTTVDGTAVTSVTAASVTSVVSSSASAGFCGDGSLGPGEQCDDGNASNNDACLVTCVLASCGDGFLFFGVEQCDDANVLNGDGCSSTCTLPACGDGVLDGMEQCDLGAANEDRPALEITQGPSESGLVPVSGAGAAALFYGYFSASSHTGFEALGASRLFFHLDATTGVLSLVVHHGIDFNTSGQHQPMSHVLMTFSALPPTASVTLSDDNASELQKTNATTANGNWHFNDNSDGGVLSGLPFPGNWTIGVSASFLQGINAWAALGGDGAATPLALNGGATLRAFDSPSACRTDCTVPSCGDGVLDGGEVCDDGNAVDGDGCDSGCLLTSAP